MTSDQVLHTRPQGVPFAAYKRQQAAISRHRLYPLTAFYTGYSVLTLVLAFRSAHPFLGIAFYLAGIPVWTLVEYVTHRYILHGRFKVSEKIHKKFLTGLANKYMDPLHWERHERPAVRHHVGLE